MKQAYVIAKVKQIGREISIVDTNISYQHAANLYLELELEKTDNSPFKDMLLSVIAKKKGTNRTAICPLVYEQEKTYILLPEEVLKQEGIVYLSLGGINEEKVVITSNMVHLEIVESNPIITSVTPIEQYWQIEVKNAMEYWYVTKIKPQLDAKQTKLDELIEDAENQQDVADTQQEQVTKLLAEAKEQQEIVAVQQRTVALQQEQNGTLIEEAKTHQETIATQQESLNTIISEVDAKVSNGDFIPNIQVGVVETGDTSSVMITGEKENPLLNFVLEKGQKGDKGDGVLVPHIVTVLPESGETSDIYFLISGDSYISYMWVNGEWIVIGSGAVDLSNCVLKTEDITIKQDKMLYISKETGEKYPCLYSVNDDCSLGNTDLNLHFNSKSHPTIRVRHDVGNIVLSSTLTKLVQLTQEEYNNLYPKEDDTVYFII